MIPIVTIKRRRKAGATVSTSASASLSASFTTLSGTWRVDAVDGETGVFLWTLDENPGWKSLMVTNEGVSDRTVTSNGMTCFCPYGAIKFAQTSEPVQINGQWIRDAITAKRWVPYRSSQSSDYTYSPFGCPSYIAGSIEDLQASTYDPATMNGTSLDDNIVGTISGQGGEYPTSRGATEDADAIVIDRALQSLTVAEYTAPLTTQTFGTAGFPGQAFFDEYVLRDPQKPISGNLPQYEYSIGAGQTDPSIESYVADAAWKTDPAHCSASGWALWMGTEDPRVGMLVQSHLQYMLATYPEYKRTAVSTAGSMNNYIHSQWQERANYNGLSAVWRARDVTDRITTTDPDVMLWSASRVAQMYQEMMTYTNAKTDEILNTSSSASFAYIAKVTSSLQNWISAGVYTDITENNNIWLATKSNFQDGQYGGVPLYLMAAKGEPLGLKMIRIVAIQMVARFYYIGGARGVDGMQGQQGSSLPLGPTQENPSSPGSYIAATPSFTDTQGWATWVKSLNLVSNDGHRPPPPDSSFKYSDAHNVKQSSFFLYAAKELITAGAIAAIPDLDNAITAYETALAATTAPDWTGNFWHKHMHDTFTGI